METETYLTFVLGTELFAVNVCNVLEVLEQQQVTRVPKTPDHILGIINFRGEILPVINTRVKFKLDDLDPDTKFFIIVFEIVHGEQRFSIASTADGVKDVIEIHRKDIKPVPELGISFDSRYISGTIRRNDSFILFINPDKVFSITDTEAVLQETV
jgi:purine-binding chemotaxis protein CheW